jgi:hypothetical protein
VDPTGTGDAPAEVGEVDRVFRDPSATPQRVREPTPDEDLAEGEIGPAFRDFTPSSTGTPYSYGSDYDRLASESRSVSRTSSRFGSVATEETEPRFRTPRLQEATSDFEIERAMRNETDAFRIRDALRDAGIPESSVSPSVARDRYLARLKDARSSTSPALRRVGRSAAEEARLPPGVKFQRLSRGSLNRVGTGDYMSQDMTHIPTRNFEAGEFESLTSAVSPPEPPIESSAAGLGSGSIPEEQVFAGSDAVAEAGADEALAAEVAEAVLL